MISVEKAVGVATSSLSNRQNISYCNCRHVSPHWLVMFERKKLVTEYITVKVNSETGEVEK